MILALEAMREREFNFIFWGSAHGVNMARFQELTGAVYHAVGTTPMHAVALAIVAALEGGG